MPQISITALSAFLLSLGHSVQAIPYSEYILAPTSRILAPVSIHHADGTVTNPFGLTLTGNGSTIFTGLSAITYDYSKNIAGIVSFVVESMAGANQYIGLSYS